MSSQHVIWTSKLIIFIFKHVFLFFFLLQLVMYRIPFARVACLVQRTMDAADVNRSCSSSFEEKACASMESACIPARQGSMDTEPQIWTDVPVSNQLLSTLFYCLCNLGGAKLKFLTEKKKRDVFLIRCRTILSLNFKNRVGWDKNTFNLSFV